MSHENVFGTAGVKKLKELAEDIDFCMFCTALSVHPLETSPMSVQEVDEDGNIWFLASKSSDKCQNITKDAMVQLLFAKPSDFKFLTVYGEATLSADQTRIDKYWNKMMEGWFEKGRQDPDITLIQLKPTAINYWDTKEHKMITFGKVLWSSISGAKVDTGVEGQIKI